MLIRICILVCVSCLVCDAIKSDQIKFGAILPLSGEASDIGKLAYEGLMLKFEELKHQGTNYELLVEDSQSNVNQGLLAFRSLLSRGVKIIFTALSRHGITLKTLAEEKKVLLFANTFHPNQTTDTQYVFRVNPTIEIHNDALSRAILAGNTKTVCILYHSDEWGTQSAKDMTTRLAERGVKSFVEALNLKDSLSKTTVFKLVNSECQSFVTFLFGSAQGLAIKFARELRFNGDIFSSINLAVTPSAIASAGRFIRGTYYVVVLFPEAFRDKFKKKYGREPPATADSYYKSLEIIDFAINNSKSTDPTVLAKFIRKLGSFKSSIGDVTISPSGDILTNVEVKLWE